MPYVNITRAHCYDMKHGNDKLDIDARALLLQSKLIAVLAKGPVYASASGFKTKRALMHIWLFVLTNVLEDDDYLLLCLVWAAYNALDA